MGGNAISLLGKDGGKLKEITDNYIIPFHKTNLIQEIQILIGHSLCNELEEYIFKNPIKVNNMQDNLFCLNKRYYLVTGAAGLLGRQHCEAILSAKGIPIAIDLNNDSLIQMSDELHQIYKRDFPIFACSVTDLFQLTS